MKKHFVLIMNIVLAVVIIGALALTAYRVFLSGDAVKDAESSDHAASRSPDAPTDQATVDPSERYKIGIVQHYNNADSNDC